MFKLLPLLEDASVCFRCQCRLARREAVRRQRRNIVGATQSRHLSSGRYQRQETQLAWEEAEDDRESVSRQEGEGQLEFSRSPPRRLQFGFSDVHQDSRAPKILRRHEPWRRLDLRSEKVKLPNLQVLGKQASIITVKDEELRPRRKISPSTILETSRASSAELLQSLDPKSSDDDLVYDNIEQFRIAFLSQLNVNTAEDPTIKACRKLARQLDDAFTSPQLEHYLKLTQREAAEEIADLDGSYVSEVYRRTRWFAKTSDYDTTALDRLEHGLAVENFIIGISHRTDRKGAEKHQRSKQVGKQRIIEQLLRQSWRLRTEEERMLAGEVDIQMQPEHLQLLLSHRINPFQRLTSLCEVNVVLWETENIVRIRGDYASCTEAVKMLHLGLQDIRCETINLDFPGNSSKAVNPAVELARSTLSKPEFLAGLEKLTSTLIKPVRVTQAKHASQLDVFYLATYRDNTDLEDVRRVVIRVLNGSSLAPGHMQCVPTLQSLVPIEVPTEAESALPLHERDVQWTRWKHKSANEEAANTHGVVYRPARELGKVAPAAATVLRDAWRVDDTLDKFEINQEADQEADQEAVTYWDTNIQYPLLATVGHMVFPVTSKQSHLSRVMGRTWTAGTAARNQAMEIAFKKTLSAPRGFLTNVAKLQSTLDALIHDEPKVSTEIVIRLKPHRIPQGAPADLSIYPDLELYIHLDIASSGLPPMLTDARLIMKQSISDLMLPTEAADLRFKAQSYMRRSDTLDPALLQFIAESNLDINGGDRLKTPYRLALTIPKVACVRKSAANSEDAPSKAKKAMSADPSELVDTSEITADSDSTLVTDSSSPPSLDTVPLLSPFKKNRYSPSTPDVRIEYMFVSLEHCSHLQMQYQGYPLVYTTIEAGKTGGRRSELRLETQGQGMKDVVSRAGGEAKSVKRMMTWFSPWFSAIRELVARVPK